MRCRRTYLTPGCGKKLPRRHVRVSIIWVPVRRDPPKMLAHHPILVERASCSQCPRDCNYGGKSDHASEADQHDVEIIAWNFRRPTPPSRVSCCGRPQKYSFSPKTPPFPANAVFLTSKGVECDRRRLLRSCGQAGKGTRHCRTRIH